MMTLTKAQRKTRSSRYRRGLQLLFCVLMAQPLLHCIAHSQELGSTDTSPSQAISPSANVSPQTATSELGTRSSYRDLYGAPPSERAKQDLRTIRIVTQGAAEVTPALKYRFWPSKTQLKPGNADIHFYRAIVMYTATEMQDTRVKINEWSLDENKQPYSYDELRTELSKLQNVIDELHKFSSVENNGADLRFRDLRGAAIYSMTIPEFQEARGLARVLRAQLDEQLSRRDFDGAIKTLQVGFRLAHYIGQGETLVQQLIGLAISNIMMEGVQATIGTPGSPNLYWAIASLPDPLLNVNNSIQLELEVVTRILPLLQDAETLELADDQWQKQFAQTVQELQTLGVSEAQGASMSSILAVFLSSNPNSARRRLVKQGFDQKRLEKMSDFRVLLIDTSRELRELSDSLSKLTMLPDSPTTRSYRREVVSNFERWIGQNSPGRLSAVIARLLYPAVEAAMNAGTRSEAGRNRLMVLEAIRMHVAANNGMLPRRLNDISIIPIPLDPMAVANFEYTVRIENGKQFFELNSTQSGDYSIPGFDPMLVEIAPSEPTK